MTTAQKIALAMSILGFIAGSGTQLTDIFSPLGANAPLIVKECASLAGFVSAILGIVLTNISGMSSQLQLVMSNAARPDVQTALVKTVAAMPGVDGIQTNTRATPALNAVAQSDAPDAAKVLPPKGI